MGAEPEFDVAIAGLGAMGSAAALELAVRGTRVIGFDRFHPPHDLGSSTGRTRIIREAYFESPFYVPLVRRAWDLWAELERRTGRRLYRRTGGLVIGPRNGTLVPGAIASAAAHAVPYERLTPAQVRERFPAFTPPDDMAAVVEQRAGILGPEDCIAAMLDMARAGGAELRFGEPVLHWTAAADGLEITTAGGLVRGKCLILAAGAWMAGDLTQLRLPLAVARQTMFWLCPAGGPSHAPEDFPIWLWETPDGRAFYGFPDLGDGPKVARHHGGAATTPDTVDRAVQAGEAEELLAFLRGAIPSLAGTVTDAKVCLYTNTPDEHFILDRHPAHPNVLVASPCSGHGFKFAPAIGEVLADMAQGRPPRYDLSPFRLGRFTSP